MSVVCSHLDEALLVPTQAVGASKAVSARRLAERLSVRFLQQCLRVGQAGGRTSAIRRARSIR